MLMVLSQSFGDISKATKDLSHIEDTFPAEVKQDDALPSCLGFHTANKYPIHGPLSAIFLYFLLTILLFKMASTCSGDMMFSVPKHKDFDMLLGGNT